GPERHQSPAEVAPLRSVLAGNARQHRLSRLDVVARPVLARHFAQAELLYQFLGRARQREPSAHGPGLLRSRNVRRLLPEQVEREPGSYADQLHIARTPRPRVGAASIRARKIRNSCGSKILPTSRSTIVSASSRPIAGR